VPILLVWLILVLAMPTQSHAESGTVSSSPSAEESAAHQALDEAYARKAEHDFAGARAAFTRALQAGANAQVVWLELGYLALAEHDTASAIEAFRRSSAGDDNELTKEAKRELDELAGRPPSAANDVRPGEATDANALLALAYQQKEAGHLERAAATFRAAGHAGANPQLIALELAYVDLAQNDTVHARLELQRATRGPDLERKRQAEQELAALAPAGNESRHFFADLYAEAFGWKRILGANQDADLVPTARLRAFYAPFNHVDLQLYVFGQITRDVASRGPGASGLPLIYADNSALFGPGLLFRFWERRIGVFAQLGPAFELVDSTKQRMRFDARIGAHIGLESVDCWPAAHSGARWLLTACQELYGEVTYISRYQNDVIAFLRGRTSLTIAQTGPLLWQLAAEMRFGKDTNQEYYNNFADAGLGPRLRLLWPLKLDLMLAPHAGAYFGESHLDPAPDPLHYADLRLQAATYVEF
jgi:hypothetical protein